MGPIVSSFRRKAEYMYKIICFDLFFTLVNPMPNNIEYKIAGVSKNNWESYMEDIELY
jgi:hypothetical protein